MPEGSRSFSRQQRLQTRAQFDAVMAHGRAAAAPALVVYAIPAAPPARIGLIVGRRVGNAVVRNRVKRRMREAFRNSPIREAAVHLVVLARSAAILNMPFKELQATLERLALKALAAS